MALETFRILVEGLDHPEGVCITPDGTLYAGGEAGQVYRIDGGTANEVATTGGFALGLTSDGDGRIYVCDLRHKLVLRVQGSTVTEYTSGTSDRPLQVPNWSVFDDEGNLYVTDSGSWKGNDGCVFRVTPEGRTEVWTTDPSNFPNGACLTADGKALLVLESLAPALVRIAINPDGSAGPRELIATLPGTVPDGVALDTDGTAWVCCYRPDRILKVSSDGAVETFADDPEGTVLSAPTNGVFMGPQLETLVTGNLGRWHLSACEPGVTGVALRYPKIA